MCALLCALCYVVVVFVCVCVWMVGCLVVWMDDLISKHTNAHTHIDGCIISIKREKKREKEIVSKQAKKREEEKNTEK